MKDAVTGTVETPAGEVPVVSTRWTRGDRLGAIRCRVSSFRDGYAVPTGLYAVGNPGASSEVLVSASYKLSFDLLRRELAGRDLWILVIDTFGINVWCAAGKGTFGTDEIVKRLRVHGVERVVSHRRIIVPQLGAPGVEAAAVKRMTGFHVRFGPVRAGDLPAYLDGGLRASPEMREVRFGFTDRLVLTPMEMVPAMKKFPWIALALFVIAGITPSGIMFGEAWSVGAPLVLMSFAALLAGAFITPVLLPFIPFRSFALKGMLAGLAVNGLLAHGAGLVPGGDPYLALCTWFLFPALSSYLALQFTGASAFTGMSGVEKELKFALPLYAAGGLLALGALAAHKLVSWRVI